MGVRDDMPSRPGGAVFSFVVRRRAAAALAALVITFSFP